MQEPVLSEFVDFRQYLAAFYNFKVWETRDRLRPYSYSDFSAAANIKSPNYLKLIIEGKRNLSREMCQKFSRAMKHTRAQAKEFHLLVDYCQERDPMQRNRNLKELSEYRAKKSMEAGKINPETWDQISSWLVWVLYAMVDQKDVMFTPQNLVHLLRGQVNEAQVQQALDKLVASGDIKIDPETKRATRTSQGMSGIDEVAPELIRKIQSELIYLGLESLHKYGPHEREVSGFTMAMTEKEFEWVRFELRKLRKQIQKEVSINRAEQPGDRVYSVNIQLFPVTDTKKELKTEVKPLEI